MRPHRALGQFATAGFVAALAVAALLAPFKSELPDGLDAVSQRLGLATLETERPPLLLGDYTIPLPVAGWWSVSLAGLLGTAIVFVGAIVLARVVRWNASPLQWADSPDG